MVAEHTAGQDTPLDEKERFLLDAYRVQGPAGAENAARHLQSLDGIAAPQRRMYSIPELGLLPLPEYLFEREIVAGGFNLLYGASGCGKSFISTHIAMEVATRTRRKVIYVAAEGASGYFNRVNAWLKHHKQPGANVVFDIEPLPLRDDNAVKSAIDSFNPLDPVLIVIDTLSRCMAGLDENSPLGMGVAVNACAAIQRRTGAAILVVHHTGKNGDSSRGHTSLHGAADSVVYVVNDDGLITVSCAKSKDSKPFADRYLRLVEVDLGSGRSSCVALPSDRVILKGAPLSPAQKKVLETLALEAFVETGAKAQSLQSQLGVSERSIYRTLSALMRDGYVRQATKGDPYFIEPKGLAAIQLPPLPTTANVSFGSSTLVPTAATATTSLEVAVSVSRGGGKNGDHSEYGTELETTLPHFSDVFGKGRRS